jgi:glycopeptide antibiotics resistance protein
MLNGQTGGNSTHLVPLVLLTPQELTTSLLNILLFVPFGVGLPFITVFRLKKVVIIGALFSVSIEILQLVTGLMAHITFRVADINDVIFNTLGVVIGYLLFIEIVRTYRNLSYNSKKPANPILRYIAGRPQVKSTSR